MDNINFISAEDIKIKINDSIIGMVKSVEVESKNNQHSIYCMLEMTTDSEICGEQHKIKLKKLRIYADDGAMYDLYNINNFILTVELPNYILTFGGCCIDSVKESCDVNGYLIEEAVIISHKRSKE